jgi:hypothetical protein
MVETLGATLALALDRAASAIGALHEEARQNAKADGGPVTLDRRIVELGLGEYIKFGTDKRYAKHHKKFAAKLGMEAGEEVAFSFSDSTFAGIYGLVVTDRAIRSRDLMEDPASQPLPAETGEMIVNSDDYTIAIGDGPVHHIGEFVPKRLLPSVADLLTEYINGKIIRPV